MYAATESSVPTPALFRDSQKTFSKDVWLPRWNYRTESLTLWSGNFHEVDSIKIQFSSLTTSPPADLFTMHRWLSIGKQMRLLNVIRRNVHVALLFFISYLVLFDLFISFVSLSFNLTNIRTGVDRYNYRPYRQGAFLTRATSYQRQNSFPVRSSVIYSWAAWIKCN